MGRGQRMSWLDGMVESMDMSLSKLREMVEARKPGVLQCVRSQRLGRDLETAGQQLLERPRSQPPPRSCLL